MSDAGTPLELDIGINADPAQARRVAEQLANIIETALIRAFDRIQDRMSGLLSGGEFQRNIRGFTNAAQRGFQATEAEVNQLANGMNALVARSRAFKRELSNRDIDQGLFASYENALQDSIQLQERFNANRVEIMSDPTARLAFEAELRRINQVLRSETQNATRILEQDHGQRIVAEQANLTHLNTARRLAGARQLAAEQSRSRARIELFRFTARQIQFIEAQLARAIRATANLGVDIGRSVLRGVGSLRGLLRRNNAEFNEGLQGALTQREQTISRSFERQNRVIRQQSQVVERLQRQTSTGLFGFLSGRSAAAGALGVGGLLGGGLLGANLLSSGLERFTQLERINIQLQRLTGSATETERILDSLTTLARETPLALTDVSQAAVGLLAAGTGLRDLVPFVQSLADAIGFTGGGAEQLQRVGLALRQIASIGRLQGEELRQLAESLPGLNIPQLLADQITEGDTALLLKMSEAGEISAKTFTEAFAKALRSDPRIVGAATATVNTLGGQIAILQESFADLGRAVIEAIEPFLQFSIQGTIRRLEFFTRLIDGETTPGLRALRTALIGVAAGLAAIIAARAAIEVFGLLATAARGLVTPLGLLVASFAALGAAVAVLRVANPVFKDMTDRFAAFASGAVVSGLQRLAELIGSLAQRLLTQGLPALSQLALILAERLAPVIGAVAGLVANVFVPALVSFASFIGSNFLPAVSRVGSAVADFVVPALRTLGQILADVLRFLDPAIRGFQSLGSAIAAAFRGDFSQIFGGLSDAASGLGTVFANIGVILYNAIRPQIERVAGLISSALGSIDLTALVVSISNVARRIGFILGNIVSDPGFINALERIVLAGALIGGRFIQGFAEGILSNLPGLIDLFVGQFVGLLGSGIQTALNNPRIIVAALGAWLFGDIVINFIRNIGRNWGKLTAEGVSQGFRASARKFSTGVQSFFAGAEAVRTRAAARMRQNTINEFQRLSRDIEALGAKPGRRVFNVGQIDQRGVQQLRAQFKDLTKGIDEAAVRAVVARGQFDRLTGGVRLLGTGLRETFQRDFTSARASFRTGLGQMQLALRDFSQDLRARGTSLGQTLGAGVLGGLGAAFSASQGGAAGAIGALGSVLLTALSAGPVAAAIAGVGAGIGLLIGHFNRGKEAAKLFTQQVEDLADALRDLTDVGDIAAEIQETLNTRFQDAFSSSAQTALASVLPQGFFSTMANDIAAGNADVDKAFDKFVGDLQLSATETEQIQKAFGDGFDFADEGDFFGALNGQAFFDDFNDALKEQGTNLGEVQKFFGILFTLQQQYGAALQLNTALANANADATDRQTESFSNFEARLAEANRGQSLTLLDQAQLRQSTQSTFDQVLGIFGDFKVSAQDVFDSVVEFARENQIDIDLSWLRELVNGLGDVLGAFEDSSGGARDFYRELGLLNTQEERLAAARQARRDEHQKLLLSTVQDLELVQRAVEELNRQRTDQLNLRIRFLQDQLEAAEEAANRAREAFTDFLTGGDNDGAARKVDQLIGNLDDIGSRLEEGIAIGGARGAALARLALGDFEDAVGDILQAGFEEGLRTPEEFAALLAPVWDALDEEGRDALARILSTVEFDEGIGPTAQAQMQDVLNRAVNALDLNAAVGTIMDADAEVLRLQDQLNAANAELNIDARFDAEQVKQALADAGLNPELLMVITPDMVSAIQEGKELASIADQANTAAGLASIPGSGAQVNMPITVIAAPGQEPKAGAAIVDAQNSAIAGAPKPVIHSHFAGFRS